MVCPSCGAQIDGQGKFCATCGARSPEAVLAAPPSDFAAVLPPPPAESSAPPTWPSTPPPPAPAAPPAWSQVTKGFNTTAVALGLGALLIGVGSFLPWITVSSIVSSSRSGLDGGDGVLTLAIGIVLVLVAFANFSGGGLGPASRALSLLGGLGAIGIAIYDGIDVSSQIAGISSVDVSGSVGMGLFVVGIGGGVAVLVALFGASHGPAATA
jgi:hypothetical protein